MEVLSPLSNTTINITHKLQVMPHTQLCQPSITFSKFTTFTYSLRANKKIPTFWLKQQHILFNLQSTFSVLSFDYPLTRPRVASSAATPSIASDCYHWMIIVEKPPEQVQSKPQVINYYVKTLQRVLGSEKESQCCIYNASCDEHFGFCCAIDGETSRALSRLPGVLSVRPDPDVNSIDKDYSFGKLQLGSTYGSKMLFPEGEAKHWLVGMDKPSIGVVSKAQMVDYYAQILTKVLRNEKDAQMCIYHMSWESNFGFCCVLDEECARELAGVPGVLSVHADENYGSENKDYGGDDLVKSAKALDSSSPTEPTEINTKKLFITGLSFYTSEKTLRAAFDPFGELVEVKIIMDKISKRSKGYAFVEYTTLEAARTALKEMNGKVINGWMIVVDVAKTNPRYSRAHSRPST